MVSPIVDYQIGKPGTKSRTFTGYCVYFGIVASSCGVTLLFSVVFLVPRMAHILATAKVTLPALTLLVLRFSSVIVHGYWIVALIGLALLPPSLASFMISLEVKRRQRIESLISAMILLFTAAAVGIVVLALVLPIF